MAVTIVQDPHGDDNTLHTRAMKRFKIITGSFDYGATAGGGVSMDIPINIVHGCVILPANGYIYAYDAGTVKAYYVGPLATTGTGSTETVAEAMTRVATGVSMATCSALNFFAWGYE